MYIEVLSDKQIHSRKFMHSFTNTSKLISQEVPYREQSYVLEADKLINSNKKHMDNCPERAVTEVSDQVRCKPGCTTAGNG